VRVGLGLVTGREDIREEGGTPGPGLLEGPDPPGTPVLVRALVDALLGAAGLEGRAELRNRDGKGDEDSPFGRAGPEEIVREGVRRIEGENYQVVNVDATLVGDAGAGLGPEDTASGGRMGDLGSRIAELLHVAPDHVSLAARTVPTRDGTGGTRRAGDAPAPRDARGGSYRATVVVLLDRIGDTDALMASIRSGG